MVNAQSRSSFYLIEFSVYLDYTAVYVYDPASLTTAATTYMTHSTFHKVQSLKLNHERSLKHEIEKVG
jgi:hypothetical protein